MQKLHLTTILTQLTKNLAKGIEYTAKDASACLKGNSISFNLTSSSLLSYRYVDDVLRKFRANLKKHRNKCSHQFHICFNGDCGLSNTALHNLGLEIATNFRNIRELTIHFFMCGDITDEGMKCLITPISKVIKHLRKLTINLFRCRNLTDKTLKCIRSIFFLGIVNLENLTFNCSGRTRVLEKEHKLLVETDIEKSKK